MSVLLLFSVLFLLIGLLLLFRPKKKDMQSLYQQFHKDPTIRQMASGKQGKVQRYFSGVQSMLAATGRDTGLLPYCMTALILAGVGAMLALLIGNVFLLPVLVLVGLLLPFLYVRFEYLRFKQLILEELESMLSAITASYERTDNILAAVKENLEYISPPLHAPFAQFVNRIEHTDPSEERAIDELKASVDHSVFWEWCDALKRCVKNRNLKYTLQPIVEKLSQIKIVVNDQKSILYTSLRDHWMIVGLSVVLLLVSLFVLPAVMNLTIPQAFIHFFLALSALVIFLTTCKVLTETKDVDIDS